MDVLSMLSVSTGTVQVLFVMNYHSSVCLLFRLGVCSAFKPGVLM